MGYRFTGMCLITSDVPRLAAFYADLLNARVKGDDTFAMVGVRGASLSVFSRDGMEQMAAGSMSGSGADRGSFTLEFEVTDVDAEHARLTDANVEIVKPPTTQAWGRRSVWLRDPDGNIVNLYQKAQKAT